MASTPPTATRSEHRSPLERDASPFEQSSLGLRRRALERTEEVGERAFAIAGAAMELAPRRVPEPAVGAFITGEGPRRRSFCTGTLIAPRVVVTAKHCTENMPADAAFAFGADARTPERIVALERFERATPDRGGFMRKGSDVAGVALAEAIADVAPVPLASRPLEIGARLVAVGYGVQGPSHGRDTRQSGELTLLALEGAALPARYSTLARFLDVATDHLDHDLGTFEVEALTEKYGRKLLSGYEAYLSDGTVQTCHGDSGGPILQRTASGFEVVAVVSGGPLPATISRPTVCAAGNIVALVGPEAREMLQRL